MAKRKHAPHKKPGKRPIEQYAHTDKKRANNPPVGLVTPSTDPPGTEVGVFQNSSGYVEI